MGRRGSPTPMRPAGSHTELYCSYRITFFGGNDPAWAPARNELAYFDDFVVSTQRITER
jgi:hypothetical protein